MTARDRAMVEWIVEKVMGLTYKNSGHSSCPAEWWEDRNGKRIKRQPHPLTSDADAMKALKAWRGDDKQKRWTIIGNLGFVAYLEYGPRETTIVSDTVARAICEALGKATGFEWKGDTNAEEEGESGN